MISFSERYVSSLQGAQMWKPSSWAIRYVTREMQRCRMTVHGMVISAPFIFSVTELGFAQNGSVRIPAQPPEALRRGNRSDGSVDGMPINAQLLDNPKSDRVRRIAELTHTKAATKNGGSLLSKGRSPYVRPALRLRHRHRRGIYVAGDEDGIDSMCWPISPSAPST